LEELARHFQTCQRIFDIGLVSVSLTYIRYSQSKEDENGNPTLATFSSHKSSRKKMNSIVIFSNINEKGKGSIH
jgi:hypothetical protein